MSANRSKDRSSLCSFTFTDGRHCRTLECGAITLRALCAPVSVPSVVNLFPRSRPSPISAKPSSQTLHLAQHEYINAYGTNSWRETIRTSHEQSANHISPDPQSPPPQPAPAPTPAEASDAPPASEQDCIHPSLLASCVTGQHRVYPYSWQWPLMVPANFPIFGVASQKRVGLPESTSRGLVLGNINR